MGTPAPKECMQTKTGNLLDRSEEMGLSLRGLYASYGYHPYKMSKFEPYDLYAQNRNFVAGSQILTFTDTDGRLMALKPDVTLSIIKNYRGGQQKTCYHENVYRNTGTSHEFREIPQVGLECIGQIDLYTQLEVLTLAMESLRRISDRAILDIASVQWARGLLACTGASSRHEKQLLSCLREKNAHHLKDLCAEIGVSAEASRVWEAIASLYGPARQLLPGLLEMSLNEEMRQAAEELILVCGALEADMEINLDFSILQDLTYYNGLVFKGYVPGAPAGILSGGQYDHLVRRLGKQAGAIGFAVYLDLLSPGETRPLDADVLLLYGDRTAPLDVIARAKELRAQGLSVRVQREKDEGRYGRVLSMEGGES